MRNDTISRQEAINELVRWGEIPGVNEGEQNVMKCTIGMLSSLPSPQPEIIRCKDCKHFEYDHVENVNGIPLIVAHEICMRWCEGTKTSENGYCFLAERKNNG